MQRTGLTIAVLLLSACAGDEPFNLADGCYYSTESHTPVLLIRQGQGTLLIPGRVRHVSVSAFANRNGRYLAVRPSFLLTWPNLVALEGPATGHFSIVGSQNDMRIQVPVEGASYEELRPGPACTPRQS